MDRPTRKPTRLKGYDYSSPGAYFLTICTRDKRCTLSRIETPSGACVGAAAPGGPQVILTDIGEIVDQTIRSMPDHFVNITVDRYVIMPNHIHLLVSVLPGGPTRASAPTKAMIPLFVSTLKNVAVHRCHLLLWQRSYHDHVVRNDSDYRRIAAYIDANPTRWAEDCFYIPAP